MMGNLEFLGRVEKTGLQERMEGRVIKVTKEKLQEMDEMGPKVSVEILGCKELSDLTDCRV